MDLINDLESFVTGRFSVAKTLWEIFKLEAKLAKLSIAPLLMNIAMLFVTLTTFWVGLFALLGYATFLVFDNLLFAIILPLLINIGLLIGLLKYLQYNAKNISFAKTRALISKKENDDYDELKETVNSPDSKAGTEPRLPAE